MFRLKHVVFVVCVALSAGAGTLADPVHAAPTAPGSPGQQVYVVQAGDYLSGIAVKLGVKLNDLLMVNRLTLNSLILPGMRLAVPVGGTVPSITTPSAPSTTATATYVVRSGDSLSSIAVKLKVRLDDLLRVNRLTVSSMIHPGMQLVVPTGGTVPTTSTATPSSSPAYVVVAGDSLSGIAARLRVTLRALLAANSLTTTSVIHPGMRLTVPAGGVLPSSTSSASSPSSPAAAGGSAAPSTAASGRATTVVAFALAQQGKPYQFNTAGPDTYDCSGLTLAAYATIGIALPHYSGAQVRYGSPVDWTTSAIKPGDLVFLESSAGSGVINHVGIATSATHWVQAPRSGETVRVGAIPMYRVVAVRRLVEG